MCGNVVRTIGESVVSCCGITLPALEADEPDEEHRIDVTDIEGELFVEVDHPMTKDHFIRLTVN